MSKVIQTNERSSTLSRKSPSESSEWMSRPCSPTWELSGSSVCTHPIAMCQSLMISCVRPPTPMVGSREGSHRPSYSSYRKCSLGHVCQSPRKALVEVNRRFLPRRVCTSYNPEMELMADTSRLCLGDISLMLSLRMRLLPC